MRDADVRAATHRMLKLQHAGEPDVLVVDELGLLHGEVFVDVAVVNGCLAGYELKSARDTLERLPAQVTAYGEVLDHAALICAENHVRKGRALVPEWWGIAVVAEVDATYEIQWDRRSATNPTIKPRAVAQLLWKDEALELLEGFGGTRGLRSKPRNVLYDELAKRLSPGELGTSVRERLRARAGWRSAAAAAPLR